jgi:DNA polymerase III subunit alpha, Gram-positive type
LKIIFFDLETTGLSSTTESILEIAAVVIDSNFNTIDTYQSFINPGKPIPYIITKLTGITDQTVKGAKTEYIVLNEFMNFVRKYSPDVVAGHNIKRFDLNWIKAKTGKYGVENHLQIEVLDTLEYVKKLHKDGVLLNYKAVTEKGGVSFKLEHLIKHFGLSAQTHRAIDDVYQNIVVYKHLKELEGTEDYGF